MQPSQAERRPHPSSSIIILSSSIFILALLPGPRDPPRSISKEPLSNHLAPQAPKPAVWPIHERMQEYRKRLYTVFYCRVVAVDMYNMSLSWPLSGPIQTHRADSRRSSSICECGGGQQGVVLGPYTHHHRPHTVQTHRRTLSFSLPWDT
jgi:hypothetical protein